LKKSEWFSINLMKHSRRRSVLRKKESGCINKYLIPFFFFVDDVLEVDLIFLVDNILSFDCATVIFLCVFFFLCVSFYLRQKNNCLYSSIFFSRVDPTSSPKILEWVMWTRQITKHHHDSFQRTSSTALQQTEKQTN
jgi:hypothetical protein